MLTKLKARQAFGNSHLTNLISISTPIQNISTVKSKIYAQSTSEFTVSGSTQEGI